MNHISEEQMLAKVLELYNRDRWPNASVAIIDSPMRRILRRRGYIETRQQSIGHGRKWYLTEKALAALINMPGSGRTSSR